MCETVEAVVFPGAGQACLREVPLASPGPEDVVVRSHLTAVSTGTERMVLLGTFPNQRYPCVVGYQHVGTVEWAGAAVEQPRVGERVVTSAAHLAPGFHSGCGMAHASRLVVPASGCARVPQGVSDESAVFTIMAAVGLLGWQKCGHRRGQVVAVTGLGLIGQFAAQIWRLGGNRVYAADPQAHRADLAARHAADAVVAGDVAALDERLRRDCPEGADVLVETTGVGAVFDEALVLPRAEGVVCVQGHYPGELCFSFRKAHWKQLRFEFPCAWGGRPNMLAVLGLMATGQLVVEPLITHRLSYRQAPEVYRALAEGSAGLGEMLGVVFSWAEG